MLVARYLAVEAGSIVKIRSHRLRLPECFQVLVLLGELVHLVLRSLVLLLPEHKLLIAVVREDEKDNKRQELNIQGLIFPF